MKKVLVALALAAFASTASAAILGSPHDMTRFSGTKGTCQYCHAPHLWVGSNISVTGSEAPLWNRNNVTAAGDYQVFTSTANPSPVPGPRSLTCLSCHDGATGNNVGVVNNGVDETLTVAATGFWDVGTNLQDDHPVGVALPTTSEYTTPGTLDANTIGLINGLVECASCHEPHKDASFFLREVGAGLCSSCHTK